MMNERKKGPIEILCKEIGFRFNRHMETEAILVSFVTVLVSEIAHIREIHGHIAIISECTAKAPSANSAAVMECVNTMLQAIGREELVLRAAQVHDLIHRLAPEDAYPCDHLIDMLSSCVSAIRFGLEYPCMSRHAAEASNHVWKHKYGISLFDSFTSDWQNDWARTQLQTAITHLAVGKDRKDMP